MVPLRRKREFTSTCRDTSSALVCPNFCLLLHRPLSPHLRILCLSTKSSIILTMAQRGEAADYYTGGAPPQQPQDAYKGQPYGQQPPQYGQNYAPPQGPPPMQQPEGYQQNGYADNKQSFEQTFKLDKPKYNDLWAGLLFIAVFLGYVAVSAISIRGYCKYSTS